jgi:hypothetical protein
MSSDHTAPEQIVYPLTVIERIHDLLKASSLLYPPEKRQWGDMESGFLERI